VHTGSGTGGHYFVFLRPTLGNKWYQFNDEDVTIATEKEATEHNYGGTNTSTSACTVPFISNCIHDLNRHVGIH
jgi:hypothetical protein